MVRYLARCVLLVGVSFGLTAMALHTSGCRANHSSLPITGVGKRYLVAPRTQSIIMNKGEMAKMDGEIAASVSQAIEDFDTVVNGNPPMHAKFDTSTLLPSDGGTTYYLGQGYKLTVLKSLASVGGVDGYFYGPIIVFDEKVVVGNSQEISHIQFYSMEVFRKLMQSTTPR